MLVIVVENAPPRLRGRLAVWLLEVRAGVYIGNYSRRVRGDDLGSGLCLYRRRQRRHRLGRAKRCRLRVRHLRRNRRVPVDLDGFRLVKFGPEAALPAEPGPMTWPSASNKR